MFKPFKNQQLQTNHSRTTIANKPNPNSVLHRNVFPNRPGQTTGRPTTQIPRVHSPLAVGGVLQRLAPKAPGTATHRHNGTQRQAVHPHTSRPAIFPGRPVAPAPGKMQQQQKVPSRVSQPKACAASITARQQVHIQRRTDNIYSQPNPLVRSANPPIAPRPIGIPPRHPLPQRPFGPETRLPANVQKRFISAPATLQRKSYAIQQTKYYPNLHPGAAVAVDRENIFRLNNFADQYRLHRLNSHGAYVPNLKYNFVTTREGEMLLHNRYRHPSLAEGQQVLYAGEVAFNNGKLNWWSNGSGHYQPDEDYAKQAGLPMDQFYSYQQVLKGEHERKKNKAEG